MRCAPSSIADRAAKDALRAQRESMQADLRIATQRYQRVVAEYELRLVG